VTIKLRHSIGSGINFAPKQTTVFGVRDIPDLEVLELMFLLSTSLKRDLLLEVFHTCIIIHRERFFKQIFPLCLGFVDNVMN
jgi:hypothetical protein